MLENLKNLKNLKLRCNCVVKFYSNLINKFIILENSSKYYLTKLNKNFYLMLSYRFKHNHF